MEVIIFTLNKKHLPIDLISLVIHNYGYTPVPIIKRNPKYNIPYKQAINSIKRLDVSKLDRDEIKLRMSIITELYYDNIDFQLTEMNTKDCTLNHWYYGTLYHWIIKNVMTINTCSCCYKKVFLSML